MQSLVEPKPRVLVIDDNPSIHRDFEKILQPARACSKKLEDTKSVFFESAQMTEAAPRSAVELECAQQGQEGYEKVMQAMRDGSPFTVVFCDIRMPPGWDGLTTIEHLWELDPTLHIVICSAFSDNTWEDIRERLGESDRLLILNKPFDNAEVMQMAVTLVEKRRTEIRAIEKETELLHMLESREQQLQDVWCKAEQLAGNLNAIMVRADESGIVQHWNKNAEQAFGISSDKVVNKLPLSSCTAWDDIERVNALTAGCTEAKSQRVDLSFTNQSGEQRSLNLFSVQLHENGEFRGVVLIGLDNTEQRQLESLFQ